MNKMLVVVFDNETAADGNFKPCTSCMHRATPRCTPRK